MSTEPNNGIIFQSLDRFGYTYSKYSSSSTSAQLLIQTYVQKLTLNIQIPDGKLKYSNWQKKSDALPKQRNGKRLF